MFSNCDAGEDSWESPGQLGDHTSQSTLNIQIVIGRTVAKARILWPPDSKSQVIGKGPVVGKDWRQKEKGAVEDEKGEVE